MEESFRRAIRKMTGVSIRLNDCPNRSSMVADLSQSMMVTWSIALFEHMDALLNNLEEAVGGSEQISYSETAWKLCDAGFPQIMADANKLYDEFRAKWIQRFSTEEVMRLLLEGGDFLHHDEEKGWMLTVKNNKQDISAFYSATIHLLVSDAEPLFVRMHGRVMQLHEIAPVPGILAPRKGKHDCGVPAQLAQRPCQEALCRRVQHQGGSALLQLCRLLRSKRGALLEPALRLRERVPRLYG